MSSGTFLGDLIDDVVSFVGRPFGIYTHDETFTDLQISNLLTEGAAIPAAKTGARRGSDGDPDLYMEAFMEFKKEYRHKYSESFLERYGYNPNTTGQTWEAIEAYAKTYLQNLYGYSNIDIKDFGDRWLDLTEKGKHALTHLEGYNYDDGYVYRTDDGKWYVGFAYLEGTNDDEVIIKAKQQYKENIIDYQLSLGWDLATNRVYLNGKWWARVSPYVNQVNANGNYELLLEDRSPFTGATMVLEIPVYYRYFTVQHASYGTKASWVKFKVLSGEVNPDWAFYWTEPIGTAPIYELIDVSITAVVPMKEDNVIVDLEQYSLIKMLRKLNVVPEDFTESLNNQDLDSAYIIFGINPEEDDDITNEVLFKVFDVALEGSNYYTGALSKFKTEYTFNKSTSYYTGVIGPKGTYQRITEGTGIDCVVVLKRQVTDTKVKKIVIKQFQQDWTVSAGSFTSYWDSANGYTRIMPPLDVLNRLPFDKWAFIYETSLCMLGYATETVEIKWYETEAFGTLLQIAAIVIAVVSLSTLSGPAMAVVNYVGATVALSYAATMAIVIATNLIVNLAIGAFVSWIADEIGGVTGAVIGAIVAVYLGRELGMFSFDFGSTESWLKIADKTLSTVNQYTQHKIEELQNDMEKYMAEMDDKMDELQEKAAEYENDPARMFISASGAPSPTFHDTEAYCSSILDTNVDRLVDYGFAIDTALEQRMTVWVGA